MIFFYYFQMRRRKILTKNLTGILVWVGDASSLVGSKGDQADIVPMVNAFVFNKNQVCYLFHFHVLQIFLSTRILSNIF